MKRTWSRLTRQTSGCGTGKPRSPHILANLNDQTALVSYDGLCAAPAAGLRRIAQRLGVEDSAERMAAARFRSPGAL